MVLLLSAITSKQDIKMAVEINSSTVIINGETIAVAKKPKYKRGVPEVSSNTSLIGDSVRVTQSRDYSKAVGEVTISLRNTLSNITAVEGWQDKVGANAIRLIDNATGFTKTFNKLSIEEDVEIDFDAESFDVTFRGGAGS